MDLRHEYGILMGFVEAVAAGDMTRESMIEQAKDILRVEDGEGDPILATPAEIAECLPEAEGGIC